MLSAAIAQLGEHQTEDLKVPGSIPGGGIFLVNKKKLNKEKSCTHLQWGSNPRPQD